MRLFVTDLGPKRGLRERVLIATDLEAPWAIAVDPSCGVIFWSDWGAHRIERAGMDGEDRMVIASGDRAYWPNGLTLDLAARRLYWVEENNEATRKRGIYSSDYWGNDVSTVTQSVTISNPAAIAIHNDRVYWTELLRHQVLTVSKDGGHVSVVLNVPIAGNIRGPWGLRVFHPDAQPQFTNVCSDSKCEQLCLPTSRLGNSKEEEPSNDHLFACLDGALANASSPAVTSPPKQLGPLNASHKTEQARREYGKTTGRQATYPPLLIAANTNGVNMYNQTAGVDSELVKLTDGYVVAVDYWLKEKVVVWFDLDAHILHVRKYDGAFDWKKTARITAPHVAGVAVDWIHGLLFRTDFVLMRVIVMDLRPKRGLRERTLISTDLEAPRAVVVDPSCGIVFWSDWGAHRIERSGMDGQERV
ncbi:low-density lipoprotein receptor-related protein 6 isoform 2, partial [Aphelenchoides avenae]